jgi:hypothetical protein
MLDFSGVADSCAILTHLSHVLHPHEQIEDVQCVYRESNVDRFHSRFPPPRTKTLL